MDIEHNRRGELSDNGALMRVREDPVSVRKGERGNAYAARLTVLQRRERRAIGLDHLFRGLAEPLHHEAPCLRRWAGLAGVINKCKLE